MKPELLYPTAVENPEGRTVGGKFPSITSVWRQKNHLYGQLRFKQAPLNILCWIF
jgi:hypothetical protein